MVFLSRIAYKIWAFIAIPTGIGWEIIVQIIRSRFGLNLPGVSDVVEAVGFESAYRNSNPANEPESLGNKFSSTSDESSSGYNLLNWTPWFNIFSFYPDKNHPLRYYPKASY